MVLDSPYPPSIYLLSSLPNNLHGQVLQLFAECEQDEACRNAYPNLEHRFGQLLEQLYRTAYHSDTIDASIDKLVGIERTRMEQELLRLEEKLRQFEDQYHLSSADFHCQFHAGELGDEADFFDWSAFYQMWLSACKQLDLLKASEE